MKRGLLVLGLFLACAVGLVLTGYLAEVWSQTVDPAASLPHSPALRKTFLIVGEAWPPFEYEEKGKLVGVDAELIEKIFGEMGVPYEIRLYPWTRAWWMATHGEADAVISVSYKASRETELVYTEDQRAFGEGGPWPENYLWKSTYYFYCLKSRESDLTFTSYEQLAEERLRICRVRGYTYHPRFLQANLGVEAVGHVDEGLQALVEEKFDLLPGDVTIVGNAIKRLGYEGSVVRLPQAMFSKPYLMPACRKATYPDARGVVKRFYKRLSELRESGEMLQSYRRHGAEDALCP